MKETDLRRIRTKAGKSQEEVSKAAGISRAAYTNIENGKRRPSVGVAQKLGKTLGFDWTLFYTKGNSRRAQKDE
ncbi:MAG: helix-turn-helix transcriptional regulator [Clostridia bacterium]|nr:helix-turn-helix transcriptional regulator [Clostridia bacterium]